MKTPKIIPLADGGRAELAESKDARWWSLRHIAPGNCFRHLRFYHSREEAEAALAYLATNGTLPPYPDEDDDDIPY